MYCDHPSCKKEVDINSVAVSQPKSAYTMFNEDGLGMTRVGGGNDNIVNVCKSCGKSEYLWESIDEMHRVSKARNIQKEKLQKYKKQRNKVILCILILISFGIIYNVIQSNKEKQERIKIKEQYYDARSEKENQE